MLAFAGWLRFCLFGAAILFLFSLFAAAFFSPQSQQLLTIWAITLGLFNFIFSLAFYLALGAKFLSKTEWKVYDLNSIKNIQPRKDPLVSDEIDEDELDRRAKRTSDELFSAFRNPTNENLRDELS